MTAKEIAELTEKHVRPNQNEFAEMIKEHAKKKLQAVVGKVRRNIESRKSEYEYLLDERELEEAYDRHLKIKGMKIALGILNKHISDEN